jgi:hypothetical protein
MAEGHMEATVPAPRQTARSIPRIIGLWALRLALLTGSLVALRFSVVLNLEEMRRGAAEFDMLSALTSMKGLSALGLAVATGFLFTMACRIPLAASLRWAPIALALLPLALLAHLPLVFVGLSRGPVSGWFYTFYFFDGQDARWVLAALVGVSFGVGVGRTVIRPELDEPADA